MRIQTLYIMNCNGIDGLIYEVGKSYALDGESVKVTEIRHIRKNEYLVLFDDGSELRVFSNNVIVYRVIDKKE